MDSWTLVAFSAVLGLWNLFCPRAVMRSAAGSRSSHGEPHPGYVFAVRAGGVAFLVMAILIPVVEWRSSHEDAARNRVNQHWGVWLRDGVDDEVRSSEGLEIYSPSTSPSLDDDESTVAILRYAVVGEDDDVLDGVPRPAGAQDGDLVLGVHGGPCVPVRLVMDEWSDQVRVAVVVAPSDAWRAQHKESRKTFAGAGVDPPEPPRCSATRPFTVDDEPKLDLVRVPLDRPLRSRALIDTTTGEAVPRVATAAE